MFRFGSQEPLMNYSIGLEWYVKLFRKVFTGDVFHKNLEKAVVARLLGQSRH
jgi:hypothetical protein